LAALIPCDRETSAAMQVVIAASQAGTNAVRLAKQTGLAIERVRSFGKRLRQAGIWRGNASDASDWQDTSNDRQRMTIILAQALGRSWRPEEAIDRQRDDLYRRK